MNRGLLYGLGVLVVIVLVGSFLVGLLPTMVVGVFLYGLVLGYYSEDEKDPTIIQALVVSVFAAVLFWPSLTLIFGMMIVQGVVGVFGAFIGYRLNPSPRVSVSQLS